MPDGRVLVQAGSLGLRGPVDQLPARLFQRDIASLSEPLRYTVGDQDRLAAVAQLTAIDWLVVTEATEAELLAPAGQTWRLVLIGLGISIVLISVLAARVSRGSRCACGVSPLPCTPWKTAMPRRRCQT